MSTKIRHENKFRIVSVSDQEIRILEGCVFEHELKERITYWNEFLPKTSTIFVVEDVSVFDDGYKIA